jgi:hypothetical protein
MNPDVIAIKVATGALRTGVDPQIVADFLDRVLALDDARAIRKASDEFFDRLDAAENAARWPR